VTENGAGVAQSIRRKTIAFRHSFGFGLLPPAALFRLWVEPSQPHGALTFEQMARLWRERHESAGDSELRGILAATLNQNLRKRDLVVEIRR
jgi:hypothetical protein